MCKKKGRNLQKKVIAVFVMITFLLSATNMFYLPQALAVEQEVNTADKPVDYVPVKPGYTSTKGALRTLLTLQTNPHGEILEPLR
ncbi:MAG: hypothetical protein CVU89_12495 [Firmicutes bacterium HGW-Firmicutes-14]|nr:MAG: hypothetical protein CVU89_12495 [Firmicutes bacterium HGW-Firmicutes-14]